MNSALPPLKTNFKNLSAFQAQYQEYAVKPISHTTLLPKVKDVAAAIRELKAEELREMTKKQGQTGVMRKQFLCLCAEREAEIRLAFQVGYRIPVIAYFFGYSPQVLGRDFLQALENKTALKDDRTPPVSEEILLLAEKILTNGFSTTDGYYKRYRAISFVRALQALRSINPLWTAVELPISRRTLKVKNGKELEELTNSTSTDGIIGACRIGGG